MRYVLITFIVFIFLIIGCEEDNVIDENPYQQEHIPWPSLANSPWPMSRHDAQWTGRSQYSGPQIGDLVMTLSDSMWLNGSIIIGENNSIYLIGSKNSTDYLYKFSESGDILWKFEFPGLHENHWTPILASNGLVYVCSQQKTIYAVDTDNGSEVWSQDLGEEIISSIVLDREGNLYLKVEVPRRLISLTPDGAVRWEISDLGGFNTGVDPAVFSPDGQVLYANAGDSLYAISVDGNKLWGYWTGGWVFWEMVDNYGNIYFYNGGDSCVTSIYPTGELRWKTHLNEISARRIPADIAPTIDSDGNIYFCGSLLDGTMGVISFNNEGVFRWNVAGAAGTDLICDVDNNVYCAYTKDYYHVCSITSDGIQNWDLQLEYSGGMAGWSPSIGSNLRGLFPLVNNMRMPVMVVH